MAGSSKGRTSLDQTNIRATVSVVEHTPDILSRYGLISHSHDGITNHLGRGPLLGSGTSATLRSPRVFGILL